MIYNNILEAVGNTPLVRLNRMSPPDGAQILVKFEGLNVGGSIKTRVALGMLEDAEQKGLIHPDTVIVEPTSGNQGVGLALCGAVKGYKVKIIMPDSVSEERRKLVQQYGAEVTLVHDEGNIGDCIAQCQKIAMEMVENNSNFFMPSQFDNPVNPTVHRTQTAVEILEQVKGSIDGFCSGFGTGGTLSGVGSLLKKYNPQLEIWAAEPEKAAILSGGQIGTHLQMGIGDGIVPKNLDTSIYDKLYIVSDNKAIKTAKDLAKKEGLLCGISSGTNVATAISLAQKLGKGKTVVTILPDTAERYFSTSLFGD